MTGLANKWHLSVFNVSVVFMRTLYSAKMSFLDYYFQHASYVLKLIFSNYYKFFILLDKKVDDEHTKNNLKTPLKII